MSCFFVSYSYGFLLIFLQINGVDVRDITHNEALDLVRKGKGGRLKLVVQKRAIQVHNPHSPESVVVRFCKDNLHFYRLLMFVKNERAFTIKREVVDLSVVA